MKNLLQFVVMMTILAACASPPPAPVEERTTGSWKPSSRSNVATPLYYTVREGDTLYAIAFRYGLDYRDLASWNRLKSPDLIVAGQSLRLVEPVLKITHNTTLPKPVPTPRQKRQAPQKGESGKTTAPAKPAPAPPTAASAENTKPATQSGTPAERRKPASSRDTAPGRDPQRWQWPTNGRVSASYVAGDPGRNGRDISGREGQTIRAAAGGSVVYSGSGLIGYGELIIIKHSDRLLSAYAHNRRRLVAQGEKVAIGQKIAEMGRNDSNEVMLHFEIRANGRPVNPEQFLPRR